MNRLMSNRDWNVQSHSRRLCSIKCHDHPCRPKMERTLFYRRYTSKSYISPFILFSLHFSYYSPINVEERGEAERRKEWMNKILMYLIIWMENAIVLWARSAFVRICCCCSCIDDIELHHQSWSNVAAV